MKKRMVSAVLASAMVVGALAGCGSKEAETKEPETTAAKQETTAAAAQSAAPESEATPAEKEYVELVVYNYINTQNQPGLEETIETVNEYLKEKLNCTLDMHIYATPAVYKETVNTIVSGGTYMDMVLTGDTGIPFRTFANQNAFLPIEDYIDEYLPVTKSQLPDGAWDAFSLNGHVYAVPMFKDFAAEQDIILNTTMMDELGLTFPEKYDTYWDIIDLLYAAKEGRDKVHPELANQPITKWRADNTMLKSFYYYDPVVSNGEMVVANLPGLSGFEGRGEGETVFCPYFTDEYRALAKQLNQMVQDGIIPYDRGAYDTDNVLRNSGTFLTMFSQGYVYYNEDQYAPTFKVALKKADNAILTTSSLQQGGLAVSAQSENVERCLEVIELFNSDPYLATVMRFGPEGIGWTDADNDNVIELTEMNSDSKNRYMYQWYGWQLGGLAVTKVIKGQPNNLGELLTAMNNEATVSANIGFAMDLTPVENEIAACSSVIAEYNSTLMKGQDNNVDQMVDDFVAKLKASGMEKIVAEAQTQLDAWRQANGK